MKHAPGDKCEKKKQNKCELFLRRKRKKVIENGDGGLKSDQKAKYVVARNEMTC